MRTLDENIQVLRRAKVTMKLHSMPTHDQEADVSVKERSQKLTLNMVQIERQNSLRI